MTLSFIICTYNRDKYIYQCLCHLAANAQSNEWEIILVNNNSTDNTAAECQRFVADCSPSNYRYFIETQQGLSFARNRGIKEATGDWFVFLDDDAMVKPNYVACLIDSLHNNPTAGAFGGPIAPFFEGQTPPWMNRWSMSFVSAIDLGSRTRVFPNGKYPIGANMGISRRAIEKVGLFNTTLGRSKGNLLGGEEKDIFLRIQTAGIPILYFPNIGVQHCIPTHRTTNDYIQRLGYGIGVSEHIRTASVRKAYIRRVLVEGIKWCGTIVLWCFFALRRQHAKGDVLILFRRNVTRGLLTKSE